jgi:hypothetical protein
MHELVNDTWWGVRCAIARRGDLPEDLAEKLANDKDSDVRDAIARHY